MNSNDHSSIIRNIDVSLARAFIATVETGGMTAAARLLNLTQGAVSQQVKRLEDLLGKQLFDRSRRELTLTPDGDRLLIHARRLVALNDEVWGLMSAPGFEGEVRLGVPHDIIRPFIPPILRSFNDAWPQVRIDLVSRGSADLKERLAGGEIDLILTTELDTPPQAQRLMTDDLVWIGCRDGRAHKSDPLPVVETSYQCTFRAARVEALERAGRDWRPVGPIRNNDTLLATVEADLALSALMRMSVPSSIRVFEKDEGLPALPPFHINLYTRTESNSAIVGELAGHIREQFARRFISRAGVNRLAG